MNPQALAQAIGQVESQGNYDAIGKATSTGDRAYGKYQIMGANIPQWTKETIGQSLTPEQFKANPQIQDVVANKKISELFSQTGTPQDTASMWFSGRPMQQAGNASDVNGTTVPAYVQRVMKALGAGTAEAATTGAYQPLTPDQFQKARSAGFSTQQIIQFEQQRKAQGGAPQAPQQQQGGGWAQNLVDYGLPIAGTIAGGLIGGAAGAPAFGIGALAGGAAGAGIGAAGGTAWADVIDQLMGWKQETPLQAATRPLLAGAVTAASGGASEALAPLEGLTGVAARTAAQSGIGAAYGAGNALIEGNPQDIGRQAGVGALFGGVTNVGGEALNSLVGQSAAGGIPRSLAEEALPKQSLSDQSKDVVGTILSFKPGGVDSLASQAEEGNQAMQSQIEPLLAQADASLQGKSAIYGQDVAQRVLDNYPNSGWDINSLKERLLKVAPEQSNLIHQLFTDNPVAPVEGLTNTEADSLKKALYASSAISRAFRNMTDPQLLADKGLAKATALTLADMIKDNAPGTEELFAKQGKYIAARDILERLANFKGKGALTFPSILSMLAGSVVGGPHVGIAAGLAERAFESPSVKLGAAGLLSSLGNSGAYQGASRAALPTKVQILQALLNNSAIPSGNTVANP